MSSTAVGVVPLGVMVIGATLMATTTRASAFNLPPTKLYEPSTKTRMDAGNKNPEDIVDESIDAYTFRDSWSLITLGDLHMEDDMSHHKQARQDCLDALEGFPILGSPTTTTTTTTHTRMLELHRNRLKAICQKPGGSLNEEELQILLASKKNRFIRSHIVSLGDLGK